MKKFKFTGTVGPWVQFQSHDDGLTIAAKETDEVENHPIIAVTNPELEGEYANAKLITNSTDLFEFTKQIYEAMWDKKNHNVGLSFIEEYMMKEAERILTSICEPEN